MIAIIASILLFKYFKSKNAKEVDQKPTCAEEMKKEVFNEKNCEIKAVSLKLKLRTLEDPNEKYMLPLIEKEEISHDTRKYRFELPTKEHILGLPAGQHIYLSATINNELVIRSYTPVSSDDDKGFVDLIVKVYRKNVHPKFPEGGKLTQYMDQMLFGDKIAFRGPSGKMQYLGNGMFSIKKLRKDPPQTMTVKNVNMIAGGSGITPMLQLITEVFKHLNDGTNLRLLYANQSEQDILLRSELDEIASKNPIKFHVWYTVDRATEQWNFSTGFINEEMIKEHLFAPFDNTITLMCGPPPMVNFCCLPILDKLGYAKEMNFVY